MKELKQISTNNSDGKKALLFVCIFFIIVISVNMTMYYLAYKSFDGLVEDNYYKRGLNYQSEKDQETNQEKLGWQVKLAINTNAFNLSVKDNQGNFIKNAKVKLTFFRPTQAGFDSSYYLKEISSGMYEQSIKLPLPGIWDVYIEVQKEKNKWKKKQRITS